MRSSKSISLVFSLAWLSAACVSAFAGPRDSGGGNDLGLDFESEAMRGIQNLSSAEADDTLKQKMRAVVASTKFIVVNQDLYVKINGDTQPALVINDPSANTVTINGNAWPKLSSEPQRQSLAVHEVLSLMKIESTGDYHISAALKNAEGSGNDGVSEQELCNPQGTRGGIYNAIDDSCSYQRPEIFINQQWMAVKAISVDGEAGWDGGQGFCNLISHKIGELIATDFSGAKNPCRPTAGVTGYGIINGYSNTGECKEYLVNLQCTPQVNHGSNGGTPFYIPGSSW
jgi:hypothetical protein